MTPYRQFQKYKWAMFEKSYLNCFCKISLSQLAGHQAEVLSFPWVVETFQIACEKAGWWGKTSQKLAKIYSKFCLKKIKTNFAGSISHIFMHRLIKQSILSSAKLANNYFNIKYFSAGLNFGWVILSWMGGAFVSQSWPKITFFQLSGLKLTFTAQLSWRKVSNNY